MEYGRNRPASWIRAMVHCGISIDSERFEIVADEEAVGPRRDLDEAAVRDLESFAERYGVILRTRGAAGAVLALGRELYRWFDGDRGQLKTLVSSAPRPFLFEVRARARPSKAEWALLRVPFELLADDDGFLAQNALLRFCPLRRLGAARPLPAPDEHRLGLVFMAAAPRGQVELDYEAEETAILDAVSTQRIDLVVEESGDPVELGVRLRELDTMQAVHLSCHGLNRWRPADQPKAEPKPILAMEDPEGNTWPTDAVLLMRELRPTPRLVFLSACLSTAAADRGHPPGFLGDKQTGTDQGAAGAQLAHSLATALVEAGLPAVLGWEGSVADRAATAFAAHCYAALAKEMDLAEAVAEARRALLGSADEVIRTDWHLARLWLGPEGGGAIVGGDRKRSLLPRSHGHKVFLDAKGEVPVAAPEMFVGRRRQLQQALRSLRAAEHAGVLLHGPGRRGKSSLAARIVSRCQDRMVPAVLFGHYDARSLVEVLESALRTVPAARDLLRQRKAEVRSEAARLEDLLVDLLCGPCHEAEDGRKPLLLIIDDLERILDADPAGDRHKVRHPFGDVPGDGAAGVRSGHDRQPPDRHQPLSVPPRRPGKPAARDPSAALVGGRAAEARAAPSAGRAGSRSCAARSGSAAQAPAAGAQRRARQSRPAGPDRAEARALEGGAARAGGSGAGADGGLARRRRAAGGGRGPEVSRGPHDRDAARPRGRFRPRPFERAHDVRSAGAGRRRRCGGGTARRRAAAALRSRAPGRVRGPRGSPQAGACRERAGSPAPARAIRRSANHGREARPDAAAPRMGWTSAPDDRRSGADPPRADDRRCCRGRGLRVGGDAGSGSA